MFQSNCEITLVSQLLDSINGHLKIIHLPIEQEEPPVYEMSFDNSNDELWLSGHRSIFSLYGSHCRKMTSSFHDSQYEGFHWDLYGNENYHHLTFESNQKKICQPRSLSEWSMHLNSDGTEDDVDDTTTSSSSDRPRTSWQAIKTKSINQSFSSTNTSDSDHYSPNPITLYRLFQRTKSQQHPCRLYQNFSDKSMCDSSTSSLSCSSNSHQIPNPKIKLKNSTTFAQLKATNSISLSNSKQSSKSNVDQCLQTSINISKSTNRLLNNHPSQSSFISHYSLPDLEFLTHYAKENPPQLTTLINQTKYFCTAMKSALSEPLPLIKKPIHTVFYCSIKLPNQPPALHPPLSTIQRAQNKTNSTMISETLSSECSSTSSSGYFSNCSTNQTRHIQTSSSPYPLKSCLKRAKTEELTKAITGDIITLAAGLIHKKNEELEDRRSSAPTTPSHEQNDISLQFPTSNKICTLSEHDLRAKKSVSFCDEIARRIITPSTSPNHRYQVPRESLTDSPPSEFNLSDNDDDDNENDDHVINFIENTSQDIIKPLPIKNESDKYLIDAFANTILRILEIKCNDPKSYYLNNQTNHELDRTLRLEFCPLLREIFEDGLRQHSGSLFSKKVNLWRLIDLTTPTTSRFNEAKRKTQVELSSNSDWIEKFNSFIYHLLNLHELTSWLTHFLSHHTLLNTYYESWAFVLVNMNNDLFECITNQLEKLSPLPFRLKYMNLSNSRISLTNQRLSTSIIPKKFNVRTWLRDRKTQVKISPRESISAVLPNGSIRRKFNSIPGSKR